MLVNAQGLRISGVAARTAAALQFWQLYCLSTCLAPLLAASYGISCRPHSSLLEDGNAHGNTLLLSDCPPQPRMRLVFAPVPFLTCEPRAMRMLPPPLTSFARFQRAGAGSVEAAHCLSHFGSLVSLHISQKGTPLPTPPHSQSCDA